MEANQNTSSHIEIDDRFIGEWIEYGMAEISSYLAKHLRFERWCDEHRAAEKLR
jgi:hypothetical protein